MHDGERINTLVTSKYWFKSDTSVKMEVGLSKVTHWIKTALWGVSPYSCTNAQSSERTAILLFMIVLNDGLATVTLKK